MENMKNVLVTGVSRGIGMAIARKLVEEGYLVHGTYNTGEQEAKRLKDEIKNIEIYQGDFRYRDQLQAIVAKLGDKEFFAVINNAGMFELENFEDFDLEIWDSTLAVNVTTPLILSLALQKNIPDGGSIVNIASSDGLIGSFASMSYGASKAALMNVTKSLANNFGKRNIRVNALAPGWIDTGMSTEESFEAVSLTPLGRNGKPEEVADLVSYLISEKASFISGTTIIIDGAYTCVDYIMKKEAEGQ